MDETITKAFLKAKYEPRVDLAANILHKIALENKRITKIKFYTFSIFGILSLIGLFPALKFLLSDFAQSGFYEYVSIAFSSNGSALSYWKELSYSLAESLPITSMIFSFGLIFIFFISFRFALKQIIKGQLSLSF